MEYAADFTIVCHAGSCKVITISAVDFIKSFKHSVKKVKQNLESKENQNSLRIETIKKSYMENARD